MNNIRIFSRWPSILITLLLIHSGNLVWAQQAAATSTGLNADVQNAINICREKLKEDPHFPKVQHSLAQLLDSQMEHHDPSQILEVVELYHAVGQPSPLVKQERLPPPSIRFDSLVRAATITHEILQDSTKAVSLYASALQLDGVDEKSLIPIFSMVMPLLLSLVVEERGELTVSLTGSIEPSSNKQLLEMAIDICNAMASKCPSESVVDEYKGATLRKMKKPQLAYQSYHQALVKSKQQYLNAQTATDQNDYFRSLERYIKASILVAAAGREGGIGPETQMKYLVEAEKHVEAFDRGIDSMTEAGIDQDILESGRDAVIDLYNNMGIVEKNRGALPQARALFMKALALKANDGHALVQLASLEDADGDDIVSNVKELDPEYVGALFDGYSSRFESELVDVLEYKGHSLVYDALTATWKQSRQSTSSIKNVIDLGCGTGLLGELIANDMPWVNLHGIDLSQRMVGIAKERKSNSANSVYGSVSNGDAAQYLSIQEKESVDCILASDVFIYIGDISSVLEESARCLVKNGLVCFTVETYRDTGKTASGLKLLRSGRFGHSKTYVENLASSKGLKMLTWKECILRKQGGLDVKGAVVVLKNI